MDGDAGSDGFNGSNRGSGGGDGGDGGLGGAPASKFVVPDYGGAECTVVVW